VPDQAIRTSLDQVLRRIRRKGRGKTTRRVGTNRPPEKPQGAEIETRRRKRLSGRQPGSKNEGAEVSVLGAILLSDKPMYQLVIEDALVPEDFYREQHRVIFAVMRELYDEGEPIDSLTVTERLRMGGRLEEAGGDAGVAALAGSVPAAGNLRHYAQIVKENALMRRLLTTTHEIQASVLQHEAAPRELVEQAERAMLEVAHDDRKQDFRRIDDILHVELDKLHRLSTEHTSLTGTPSGFGDLDNLTGGFQPGNLLILERRQPPRTAVRRIQRVPDFWRKSDEGPEDAAMEPRR